MTISIETLMDIESYKKYNVKGKCYDVNKALTWSFFGILVRMKITDANCPFRIAAARDLNARINSPRSAFCIFDYK